MTGETAQTSEGDQTTSARRSTFAPTVLIGLAAAGLASVAATRVWNTTIPPDATPVPETLANDPSMGVVATSVGLTGGDINPLVSALALVALASWGALLVLRGRTRQAVAVLGGVAAIGALGAWGTAVLGGDTAALPGQPAADPSWTAWPTVTAIALVLTLLAFAVAVRDARTWPAMSSRYDNPAGREQRADAAVDIDDDDPRAVWRALDEGDDPTS